MTSANLPLPSQNPDKALWRAIHQGLYDDPGTGVYILSQCVPEIDWQAEVINRYRVQQICTDSYTAPTVSPHSTCRTTPD